MNAEEERTRLLSRLWRRCQTFDYDLHSVLSIRQMLTWVGHVHYNARTWQEAVEEMVMRFTSLSVRVVHLKMAWGPYTDTFLNAFTVSPAAEGCLNKS